MKPLMQVALLQLLQVAAFRARGDGVCEMRDGDCPSSCPAGQGRLSATPVLRIPHLCSAAAGLCLPSPAAFTSTADAADNVIRAHSNGSDIISFDDTRSGLHTSMLYTCCHTMLQVLKLRSVLRALPWSPFWVNYSNAGCNLDMHGSGVVYIHAMPDPEGQAKFLNLTKSIDAAMEQAGLAVHHPRSSKFHMTLARVNRSYNVSSAVAALRSQVFATAGLRLLVCQFQLLGEVFEAQGGCRASQVEPPMRKELFT